jgi:hypothetical protein
MSFYNVIMPDTSPLIFYEPPSRSREGLWIRFRKGISEMPGFLRKDDPTNDAPDRRIGPCSFGLMEEVS